MNFYSKETQKFTAPDDLDTKIPIREVHRFIVDCMQAVGTSPGHASQLADVLIAADVRGHYSHGLNRLDMYVNDVEKNICNGGVDPRVLKESVSVALVDGNNALGPVVGNFCMNMAIQKAKETGIGWVSANHSNHFGIAGWYSLLASNQGLIGMTFSNAFPAVAPTRAKQRCFGTNPIAVAAPASSAAGPFVLDMSTSVVAMGKVEIQRKKQEPIPEGWALDKDGNPTTDPSEALAGSLMPLGGPEENSGYKGYGLAMMVEMFSGILSGSSYGPNIKHWSEPRESNLGQTFVAIDPTFFAAGFTERITDLMDHCKNMEPADASKPVLVAGDPERRVEEATLAEGSIVYHKGQVRDCYLLAKYLRVRPMMAPNTPTEK